MSTVGQKGYSQVVLIQTKLSLTVIGGFSCMKTEESGPSFITDMWGFILLAYFYYIFHAMDFQKV